jgi:hypothetical protein
MIFNYADFKGFATVLKCRISDEYKMVNSENNVLGEWDSSNKTGVLNENAKFDDVIRITEMPNLTPNDNGLCKTVQLSDREMRYFVYNDLVYIKFYYSNDSIRI